MSGPADPEPDHSDGSHVSRTAVARRARKGLFGFVFLIAGCSLPVSTGTSRDGQVAGITFAVEKGHIYLPAREAADRLNLSFHFEPEKETVQIDDILVNASAWRSLPDGTLLIRLGDLARAGATLRMEKDGKRFRVSRFFRGYTVVAGPKHAVINLAAQRLRAWQGDRLVMDCRISSGSRGSTPTGNYTAGPYKARRHYSSLYDNAPMPWSVQVTGHVFIHGFTSVPDYPASHGCIRLPLDEGNPAKFFYEWVDVGTPIRITRAWATAERG